MLLLPSKNGFTFRNKKEIAWDKVWGIRGWGEGEKLLNAVTIAEVERLYYHIEHGYV